MDEEKKTPKKAIVTGIIVNGFELYQCGTATELFPEAPLSVTFDYNDFLDKEEYRTLTRILTKILENKINAG